MTTKAHPAVPRSPEWPRVEAAHLRRQPRCQCCKPGTSTTFFGMSPALIRSDPRWPYKEKNRLRPLGQMTPADEALFRHAMSTRFPRALRRSI